MKSKFGIKPYFGIFPCLLVFFLFCILPQITNFYYAMTDFNGVTVKGFIGLDNYRNIFVTGKLFSSLKICFIIAILVTVVQNLLAVLIAIFASLNVRGSDFFRATYFFPTAMGIFACASIWNILLDTNFGQLPEILRLIGLDIKFWGTTKSLYTVIAIQVWMSFGYAMTIYFASIKSISADLYEAATIDGAGLWATITRIVLPMILPSIKTNVLLSMIGALKLRDIIFITTGGGPMESSMNLPLLIYEEAFAYSRHGLAAAYNVILFAVILAACMVVLYITNHAERKVE